MSSPLLTGTAAKAAALVGLALAAVAPQLPPAWQAPAAIVGYLACGLAGLASPPLSFAARSPLLQGSLLSLATTAGAFLQTQTASLPLQWQSVAMAGVAVLALVTGHSLPQLGATKPPPLELPPLTPTSPSTVLDR